MRSGQPRQHLQQHHRIDRRRKPPTRIRSPRRNNFRSRMESSTRFKRSFTSVVLGAPAKPNKVIAVPVWIQKPDPSAEVAERPGEFRLVQEQGHCSFRRQLGTIDCHRNLKILQRTFRAFSGGCCAAYGVASLPNETLNSELCSKFGKFLKNFSPPVRQLRQRDRQGFNPGSFETGVLLENLSPAPRRSRPATSSRLCP